MQNELTPEVLEELEQALTEVKSVYNSDLWRELFTTEIVYREARLLESLGKYAPALIAAARERDELKALFEEHKAQSKYKPGGPWNVSSEPGAWLNMAQKATKAEGRDE